MADLSVNVNGDAMHLLKLKAVDFLSCQVYGIDSQEMFLNFLEQSFLPDLRAATMMDSVSSDLEKLNFESCFSHVP